MTPELAYFLKINVAIALFYAFYRLFFHKDTFFHWRRTALLCFFGISLLYPLLNIQEWIKEQEPMVAMADLYATIILPGANHRGTTGNNGQLAGANPTNSGIYLLDRCITSCPTLPDPAGQYHTIAFPMPEKHDTRITCTHIKERYRPLFLLPLDIHTSGIAYRIRDQRNNHA